MLKFLKVREKYLELILKWRARADVTHYMITDIKYDVTQQREWFRNVSVDDSCKYWIISYQSTLIGLIYLTDIDYNNKHCKWGYYIGEPNYRGIGSIIPPYLYNYVFSDMKFNKIIAEVMEGNNSVIRLHQLHGYRFVGAYKQHIFKYDKYHDLFVYELLNRSWHSLQNKYGNYVVSFEK